MYDRNLCLFVPYRQDCKDLYVAHFVLETEENDDAALHTESLYKMYYVCEGAGFLHTVGRVQPLKVGDVFFTFPAEPFAIEATDGLKYMYVSFLGTRGNRLLDALGIDRRRCLFRHMTKVGSFWEISLITVSEFTDLLGESVLLYTFACLEEKRHAAGERPKPDAAQRIKKYIEEHFSHLDFSLEMVAQALSYNKKYVSTVFKKAMGMGVVEYLNLIRVRHACTMAEQGFTSVSDISLRCGFVDAQYFSKVFRKQMGMSPSTYIKALAAENKG